MYNLDQQASGVISPLNNSQGKNDSNANQFNRNKNFWNNPHALPSRVLKHDRLKESDSIIEDSLGSNSID